MYVTTSEFIHAPNSYFALYCGIINFTKFKCTIFRNRNIPLSDMFYLWDHTNFDHTCADHLRVSQGSCWIRDNVLNLLSCETGHWTQCSAEARNGAEILPHFCVSSVNTRILLLLYLLCSKSQYSDKNARLLEDEIFPFHIVQCECDAIQRNTLNRILNII
jgi:hypothetical protein